MVAQTATRFTVYREQAGRFGDLLRRLWARRITKIAAALLALPFLAIFLAWVLFRRDLPSAQSLLTYQPRTV